MILNMAIIVRCSQKIFDLPVNGGHGSFNVMRNLLARLLWPDKPQNVAKYFGTLLTYSFKDDLEKTILQGDVWGKAKRRRASVPFKRQIKYARGICGVVFPIRSISIIT